MSQFYDDKPRNADQILTNVAQLESSFGFIKEVFQNFCTTWSNTGASGIFPNEIIRKSITASYTVTAADTFISANGATNAIVITLEPAATAGAGRMVAIKATNLTNSIRVTGNGSETIEGLSNFAFTIPYQTIYLVSTGSAWAILSDFLNIGQNVRARDFGPLAEGSYDLFTITPGDAGDYIGANLLWTLDGRTSNGNTGGVSADKRSLVIANYGGTVGGNAFYSNLPGAITNKTASWSSDGSKGTFTVGLTSDSYTMSVYINVVLFFTSSSQSIIDSFAWLM